MEGLCMCFPFLFFCIIVCILVSLFSSRHRSLTGEWDKFASEAGLNITVQGLTGIPRITGKYRDFDYVLETVTEGYGEDSITCTVITMKLPEVSDSHIHIYKKSFWSNIGKIFGGEYIQTGNKEFDDSFIVKSLTPHKIYDMLTPELQRKMSYGDHLINMTLSEKRLQNKTARIIDNAQDLLYLSELMAEFAMNVSGKAVTSYSGKELPENSYKREKNTSIADFAPEILQKSSDFTSDFTGDFTVNHNEFKRVLPLKEEKKCPSCGATSPSENKYCIDCGREI